MKSQLRSRLERLEARTELASQAPRVMTIQLIGADREVKSSLEVKIFARVREKQ